PDNAPHFTFTTSEYGSTTYNGYELSRASDSLYWKGSANQSARNAKGGYQLQFSNESWLERDRNVDGVGASHSKYQLIANRNMQIGNMGTLDMNVSYLEES